MMMPKPRSASSLSAMLF
jgi:hypothetical protein